MPRRIAWFSCGASSAVAAKLAFRDYGAHVVYCDTSNNEHPDNDRFLKDCEAWIGCKIERIRSKVFGSIEEVFVKRRYMGGVGGAPCTNELKKLPREEYQYCDDVHIFGYTSDETKRARDFEERNPSLFVEWILIDYNLSNAYCKGILQSEGIKLPELYDLGFKHNNCIGCVKSSSPEYWKLVRKHFPEVFMSRCQQSRTIGAKLLKVYGQRMFLDELQEYFPGEQDDIDCGPVCVAPRDD